MKKALFIVLTLVTVQIFGQNSTPSGIVNICSGVTAEDVPEYTYFKDVNNTFDNFVGTWQWINGNEIVKFKLTKVTQYYFPEDRVYRDHMVGNYSYSNDGGTTYVVNTISALFSPNPEANPMYAPCVEDINTKVSFTFEDVILNKGYCDATFEFLPGSVTQMQVSIENPKEIPGRLNGEPPYNFDFTLPTEMIVTKQ